MSQRGLVIVPAFNEAASISEVLSGLRRAAPYLDRLVILDGSRDGTADVIRHMGETAVVLPCNVGYGHALQVGFQYALTRGYDVIVTFDADGQHRPEDVPRLLAAMADTGADVVIGSRFDRQRPYSGPLGRRFGQRLLSLFTGIFAGERIYDTTSGLKAMRRRAVRLLASAPFLDLHVESVVRLKLQGLVVTEAAVDMGGRWSGRSMYSSFDAITYPVKVLLLSAIAVVDSLLHRGGK